MKLFQQELHSFKSYRFIFFNEKDFEGSVFSRGGFPARG